MRLIIYCENGITDKLNISQLANLWANAKLHRNTFKYFLLFGRKYFT